MGRKARHLGWHVFGAVRASNTGLHSEQMEQREGKDFHHQLHGFRHKTCLVSSQMIPRAQHLGLLHPQTPAPSAQNWIFLPATCPQVLPLLVLLFFKDSLCGPGWLQNFKTRFHVTQADLEFPMQPRMTQNCSSHLHMPSAGIMDVYWFLWL